MPGEGRIGTTITRSAATVAPDGTRIAYRVVGDGGTPLVFLHGWGASGTGRFWNATLEQLDVAQLRAVLIDLRGHGDSGCGQPTITSLAGDVVAVLDAEQIDRAILVGHSVGGRLALWLATSRADRVRGQILFASVPPLALPFTDQLLDRWLAARATRHAWATLLAGFTKSAPSVATVDDYFADVARADERGLRGLFNLCRENAFADRLASITCPTLIVAGTHDVGFPPALLRDTIQRPIDRARLTSVDCGHEIPLERPDVTAALIEAFVTGR
jgi:pimeloyl-ACP methyl ester carboxylesterase